MLANLPPPPDLTRWIAHARHQSAPPGGFRPRRIMVIGLGTPAAFSLAAAYPDAEIRATDEHPMIVSLVGEAARDLALGNLSVVTADRAAPQGLTGLFDWIHCPDPLTPADDEAAAWRAVADSLAPEGFLTCRFRSLRREYWGDEFRETLRICMGAEPVADLEGWMALGAQLSRNLGRSGSRLAPIARSVDAQLLQEAPLAAALSLLPAGRSHSLASIRALVADAGLLLLGFLNQSEWETPGLLAEPELARLERSLTPDERYDLADILRAPEYLLVCGHGPARDRSVD
jgi:hypothetical protein